MPHALGKKSLARMSDEIEVETGREPNRSELFIASRSRSDGTFVCEEARIYVDKLKQVMTESSIQSEARDAYEQVFGPENPGRVRCVGRGPTPSNYFSNLECTSSTAEVKHLKGRVKDLEEKLDMVLRSSPTAVVKHWKDRVKDLEEKLDIVTSAVCKLVESKVQDGFQVSARAESKNLKKNLHQSSSINSDQESGTSKTGI